MVLRLLVLVASVGFFFLVAGLVAIDLVSWQRTRPVRLGTASSGAVEAESPSFRSSRSTQLAALAGLAASTWGATGARSVATALPIVAGGLFIAVAGSVARVTMIRVGQDELVVFYAGRPPRATRWTEIRGLRPPGTPVAAWRLTADGRKGPTLMPSDLFGHEEVLALIVDRSGLSFDGREWIRDEGEPAR